MSKGRRVAGIGQSGVLISERRGTQWARWRRCVGTVAVASSTARMPPAAVVLLEAMMRSSCSSELRMRFHEAPSSPPMQCAMLKTALSACTFLAESRVCGSGS